jgi:hypothetical protein
MILLSVMSYIAGIIGLYSIPGLLDEIRSPVLLGWPWMVIISTSTFWITGIVSGSLVLCLFYLFENLSTDFHTSCTSLHSPHQYMTVPFFLHPHHHLLLIGYFIAAIRILWSFWFAFPFWFRMLNISWCIYYPFVCLLLRTVCSIHSPVY